MKNRNLPEDNNWITPKWFYDQLDSEFRFDHDPCPFNTGTITEETDGLNLNNKWGQVNFINPPYDLKTKERFVWRAIAESSAGKTCIMLLPVSTSTKLFHTVIKPFASEIRFIAGRIKFQKKDANGNLYTPPGGMHDSMVVVFKTKGPAIIPTDEETKTLRKFDFYPDW